MGKPMIYDAEQDPDDIVICLRKQGEFWCDEAATAIETLREMLFQARSAADQWETDFHKLEEKWEHKGLGEPDEGM